MAIARAVDLEQARSRLPTGAGVIVCVPVFDAYDDVVQCVSALVRYTEAEVPLLILDDGSSDPRFRDVAWEDSRPIVLLHQITNRGFVANVNQALDLCGRADVVVVNSDVIVGPEWLSRLRAAAYRAFNVATATPLTNSGTMLSVGDGRNHPGPRLPDAFLPAQAAERIATLSPKLRPLIPTAIGHCTYFRRDALDVVGSLDEAFSPGYSEEVDFSQRALAMGFVHICADDVFVFHKGGSSFGHSPDVNQLITEHHNVVRKRYPYYSKWVSYAEQDAQSPLAASLLVADAALRGMRVIIDGSNLGPTMAGTQRVVFETARALAGHREIAEVTVVVPPSVLADVRLSLEHSGARVLVSHGQETSWDDQGKADVAFRPSQVTRVSELQWLLRAGERAVVCQHDCIAYNNPAYFTDWSRWNIYREANEMAFQFADGVTFVSDTSRKSAAAAGLVAAGPSRVVYNGTDGGCQSTVSELPCGLDASQSDFFLCLGVSYKHKNRLAALRIWEAAVKEGWEGGLVLAGPTPPEGHSLPEEEAFLLERPWLRSRVWRLGAVSDAEREWLYCHAALVLNPTVSEGFGLVPFEAAARNVPCLSTRCGSLDELLPVDIPTIELGDLSKAGRLAIEMAAPGGLRDSVCELLVARGHEFTWEKAADALVEFFWQVMGTPRRYDGRVASLAAGIQRQDARRPGLGATVFGKSYPVVAWSIRQVVEHPRLRHALAPPGSARLRLGEGVVRFVDRQTR